jgi:RNA polymerase sigma-70 factor, ECF subfamily
MSLGLDEGWNDVPLVDDAQVPADAATRKRELAEIFASEAAFRAFYERTLPRVYGYLYHRCHGDAALAEDLTQSAFTEAIRHHRSFDGRSDAVTWLTGIARHKLLDHLRREARDEERRLHLTVREIVLDDGQRPWQAADDRAVLSVALARLPAVQQAVLILHYADGMPVAQVAREIHRSESATESLLTRARAALRVAYEEASHD